MLSSQDMSVGTMTTYYCVSGYVLVGQVTRTCEDARGETIGIWSGTTPICEGTNHKQKRQCMNSLSIVNKLLDCITYFFQSTIRHAYIPLHSDY